MDGRSANLNKFTVLGKTINQKKAPKKTSNTFRVFREPISILFMLLTNISQIQFSHKFSSNHIIHVSFQLATLNLAYRSILLIRSILTHGLLNLPVTCWSMSSRRWARRSCMFMTCSSRFFSHVAIGSDSWSSRSPSTSTICTA